LQSAAATPIAARARTRAECRQAKGNLFIVSAKLPARG
jgi:hypothetical protein